ncbi:hypothetical protein Q5P01_019864 [Channa striata]|uniref:Uncharacterized protein n=1 Tax=Channa striata TaxID=64152 RepID=A0AA88M259_CHASR|nr:hypothetical protein Q5P01_019864 [Channa striata]
MRRGVKQKARDISVNLAVFNSWNKLLSRSLALDSITERHRTNSSPRSQGLNGEIPFQRVILTRESWLQRDGRQRGVTVCQPLCF